VVTEASVMHHDERFHPNASKFDPGRYIADKPDTYAWIPIGGGVRRCIGAAFAQLEMDVVLRTVLRHFALRATDAPGERASFRGVAFAPADGGIAVVRRRSTPLATTGEPGAAAPQCPIAHHRSPAARALSASVPTESRARPS
jgi:cytochrome P450